MQYKSVTVIRWVLAPFASILCPFILLNIANLILPHIGEFIWDSRGYYEIGVFDSYWYSCLKAFIFGAGFILPLIFILPSHAERIIGIVRIVLLTLLSVVLILAFTSDIPFGFWSTIKLIGLFLSAGLGFFVDKFFDHL